jgi:putative cell wall-binding protein
MNTKIRRGCVTFATAALAAAATLAASPAQATDNGVTHTKRPTNRTAAADAERLSGTTTTGTLAGEVFRIAGSDRIQTAIEASLAAWDDAGTPDGALAEAVVLTRYDEYADALGGAALAGAAWAPLLLTPPTTLNPAVKAEIDRVLGGTGTVYILGGVSAVSAQTEQALQAAGYTVVRLAGADRYETSVKVAERVSWYLAPDGKPEFVFATTGLNFPDGLAAGATAGGYGATVVLTRDSVLTAPVKTYLDQMAAAGVRTYAVGGAAANVARTWSHEFSGTDRYETAAIVADVFWGISPESAPPAIGLATGLNWPDALAGGAFMAGMGPLMLTRPDSLPTPTADITNSLVHLNEPSTVEAGFVFGGEDVVGLTPTDQFAAILGS